MKRSFLLLICLWLYSSGIAQNYSAVNGSPYEGSLTVHNNPASIVSCPYPWDLTLFGTQIKSITNAFTIHNYSLLSSPANSQYSIDAGDYARYADLNFNTNLLNARIALDRKKAIAFGVNLRGYAQVKTAPYNFIDTIRDISNFLLMNDATPQLEGHFESSTWIEVYGTYAQTIWDDDQSRLNAGITLKANRGISGAFGRVKDITVSRDIQAGEPVYNVQTGQLAYGYSSNYDSWQTGRPANRNLKDFLTRSEGSLSLDFGMEYIVKTQAVNSYYDKDDGYYEYEWKIGLSLLDVGETKYRYGNKSAIAGNPISGLMPDLLEQKFSTIAGFPEFNDSLASIVKNFSTQHGEFTVYHPARLILNVDKYLINDFYINGELSANLSPLAGEKNVYVRELNLLTVTPRWETKRWGAYLPVQYNNDGKFWIGAAFKAGPLLLGVHNLANIFSTNKMQEGGGYLAIIIHPGKSTGSARYKKVDCP